MFINPRFPRFPAAASASASEPASSAPTQRLEGGGDIAFKPTTDGWGYSHVYGNGWDNIFKKKGKAQEPPPPSPPAPVAASSTWPPAPRGAAPDPQQQLSAKLEALDTALGMGALSPALYEQARRELA